MPLCGCPIGPCLIPLTPAFNARLQFAIVRVHGRTSPTQTALPSEVMQGILCVCVCVCVCVWTTFKYTLHGLNCCIDCIPRCKRQCEKVREILLDSMGHVSQFPDTFL